MEQYIANTCAGDGYSPVIKYRCTVDRKLKNKPYAQAGVIFDPLNDAIRLYSYCTNVATLFNDEWLIVYGYYSVTTQSHVREFIREYCVPLSRVPGVHYKLRKKNQAFALNLLTGEFHACIDPDDQTYPFPTNQGYTIGIRIKD